MSAAEWAVSAVTFAIAIGMAAISIRSFKEIRQGIPACGVRDHG